jgi:ribosomal protein S2
MLDIPFGETNKTTQYLSATTSYGVKYKKNIQNSRRLLSSVFRILNVVQQISYKKGTLLLVGSSKEIQKFFFFFKYQLKRSIFLSQWLSGFLTNWFELILFINKLTVAQLENSKKSKKLRFLRFFHDLQSKPKPDLVLFLNYCEFGNTSMLQECVHQNIPIIALGSFSKPEAAVIPYKVTVNTYNFNTHWFFIQLFFNQLTLKLCLTISSILNILSVSVSIL